MLRSSQVEPFVSDGGQRVTVAFLEDPDGRVAALLDRILKLVRRLEGAPRSTVIDALHRQQRRVRDAQRLDGLSKSLLDRCRFRPPPGADRAFEVRQALFRARGRLWPPTPVDLRAPYEAAAGTLDVEPDAVDRLLYADRPEALRLVRAPSCDGRRLLALYNLDLVRGVLMDAVRVRVSARGRWGDVFRAAKLARLMYRIRRVGEAYEVELTGPASSFLVNRRRYGVRFAGVVPPLTRAPGWRLEADLERGGGVRSFVVDGSAPVAGSRGRGRPRYDSSWERSLARDFLEKLGGERDGWTLHREADPVPLGGGEVLLPDFTFRHRDGRRALIEIVGFWTPEYLERKIEKIQSAPELGHLVLAVYRGLAVGDPGLVDAMEGLAPGRVLWFVKKPVIRAVMDMVERVAVAPEGPDPSS